MPNKHIAIIIPSLRLGGAEQVAARLMEYLHSKGYQISLLTRMDTADAFAVPQGVNRLRLSPLPNSRNPFSAWLNNRNFIQRLKKAILQCKPDLIISFMNRTNIHTSMALKSLDIPFIITEHNYPPENPLGFPWEGLRKRTYRRANALVSPSKGISDSFQYLDASVRQVIPNPVGKPQTLESEILLEDTKKYIVTAGRLHWVKDYPFLIQSFSRLANEFPQWDLIILGEGSERQTLESMIEQLKIKQRVLLPGRVSQVQGVFKSCHIFCLTSRTEGLGNVILEAMQMGLPIISVDCPTGPSEILEQGRWGRLIPMDDPDAWDNALKEMMQSEELRQQFQEKSLQRIQSFEDDITFDKWEGIIQKCL